MSETAKHILAVCRRTQRDLTSLDGNAATSSHSTQGSRNLYSLARETYVLTARDQTICDCLAARSISLACSYFQVKCDLHNVERQSWAGTAHELRELVRNLLEMLAPDQAVCQQHWYKQEPNTSGPTQKQRVRYALEQRGASSSERGTAESIADLDESIAGLVRATYKRASDASHRSKAREEVSRILNYFEAFALDIFQ